MSCSFLQADHTQWLLQMKFANIQWRQAFTPFNIDFLQSLYSMPKASRPYARLISNLEVARQLINTRYNLDLTLDQFVMFTQDEFDSGDWRKRQFLVSQVYDAWLTFLQPYNADRQPYDKRKLSTTIQHQLKTISIEASRIRNQVRSSICRKSSRRTRTHLQCIETIMICTTRTTETPEFPRLDSELNSFECLARCIEQQCKLYCLKTTMNGYLIV